jgi:hypothetical protein
MQRAVKVTIDYSVIIDSMVNEVRDLYLTDARNTYNDVEGYEGKEE